MAVYSPITKTELLKFLKQYDIGQLINFEGILEGIENTNYKIVTSKNTYILTIFEKRVKSEELPFFINLKNHLVKKKFPCPKPIKNKKGNEINNFKNKLCVIISYLDGSKATKVLNDHCQQVGMVLSSLHIHTKDFKEKRSNGLSYIQWRKLYEKCKSSKSLNDINFLHFLKKELLFLEKQWPKNLPKGIVHADVFKDNVFFKNDQFSGLIDFYFSCNDFLAYDIALTINAWCFNHNSSFNKNKFKALIKGYQVHRILTLKEKNSLSILLRGAAVRILLTRLHDYLFHQDGSFVETKDPKEYILILKFHQKTNIANYLL